MSAAWEDFWLSGDWSAGSALTKSLADTVTMSDAATRAATKLAVDILAPADFVVRAPTMKRTDAITGTDGVAKTAGHRSTDSLVIIDSEQETGDVTEVVGIVKGDAASLSDSQRVTYTLRVADATSAVDNSPVPQFAGARSVTVADSGVLIETVTIVAGFVLSVADIATLSDTDRLLSSFLRLLPDDPGVLTLTPLE